MKTYQYSCGFITTQVTATNKFKAKAEIKETLRKWGFNPKVSIFKIREVL
jgi:hypothetical protein